MQFRSYIENIPSKMLAMETFENHQHLYKFLLVEVELVEVEVRLVDRDGNQLHSMWHIFEFVDWSKVHGGIEDEILCHRNIQYIAHMIGDMENVRNPAHLRKC
jgi:hypothetical protein